MIDNVTLNIEELKLRSGSYIEAVTEFMELHNIYDPEDVLEVIHPILKNKIREEFIKKNHIPSLKRNTLNDFT